LAALSLIEFIFYKNNFLVALAQLPEVGPALLIFNMFFKKDFQQFS